MALGLTAGRYFHLQRIAFLGRDRTRTARSGYGVTTYIVLFTTSG